MGDRSGSAASGRGRADSAESSRTAKSSLVAAAERHARSSAVMAGSLRKMNSAGRWQKRYFEVVGQFFVYYKNKASEDMLCAMDLWRASAPELVPADPRDADSGADFAITWDRFRAFRAGSKTEALRWVDAITAVQARRPGADRAPAVPASMAAAAVSSPARRASRAAAGGGAEDSHLSVKASGGSSYGSTKGGGKVEEWSAPTPASTPTGTASKGARRKADGDGGGCCTVV